MNILFLYPKRLWETKMSIGRTLYPQYLEENGHTVTYSGDGWDNLSECLANQHCYDFAWLYSPESHVGHKLKIPRLVSFNEANDSGKVLSELTNCNATHVLFNHWGDYVRWDGQLDAKAMWIGGHACNPTPNECPFRRHVLFSGVTSARVYPLREKYREAFPHATRRMHPGYRLANRQQIEEQYITYRCDLWMAKASLCCSSIHRYPLAKMVESAAMGAVVVTDLPDCPYFETHLWDHCIQVDADWQPEKIREVVMATLESPEQYDTLRQKSLAAAKLHFSPESWARRFNDKVKEAL